MSPSLIKFINDYEELIDLGEWKQLLDIAATKLSNHDVKVLVDALHESIEGLDLSDIQWILLYEYLPERITHLKKLTVVKLSNLLSGKTFGLDVSDLRWALLDDDNLEWKETTSGIGKSLDYILVSWNGKRI